MKKIILILVMGILMCGLLSCRSDNSEIGLIGRWQDINFPQYEIEFSGNGKFYNFTNGENVDWGYFSVTESTITLEYTHGCEGDNCSHNYIFRLTGEELIFTSNNIDEFIFRKVE